MSALQLNLHAPISTGAVLSTDLLPIQASNLRLAKR